MKKSDILVPLLAILGGIAVGITTRIPVNLRSFNAGELSPLMNARSDYPKYSSGAKTLQNMLVRSQGPISRRPGTKYIASVKDATDATRLIPFEYSTTDAYVIEMGEAYMRFYRNGGQILDVASDPYEIVTPYTDGNDLFEIQFAQDAEFMRLVHPDYPPQKLTRTAHTSWTINEITPSKGPFQDENETTTSTIEPNALTGTITLEATASTMFSAGHVGSIWQITHIVEANSVTGGFVLNWAPASNPPSSSLGVSEDRLYDFSTSGAWNGTVRLQRSYDDGATWEDVTVYSSNNSGNVQFSGQEEEADAYYRVSLDDNYVRTDRSYLVYTLTARTFNHEGVVEILTVVDSNSATATVVEALGSTDATYRWAEGSWSDYRGWPRTVEHHEQRAIYGGSDSFPQVVWSSITSSSDTDYDDFDNGTGADDDAWTYVLPGMNPIQWLKSEEFLMVGTTSGVGRLGTRDKPLTPTFVEYTMQNHTGSAYIQAVHAANGILFVERGRQKVREVMYSSDSDRYLADDMTILAEHITGTGIVQIGFQDRPDPVLWCVRDDGQLLSFTYYRSHDVSAWSRQVTDGEFSSVAVIPGTNENVVYSVVDRNINSSDVKYVEYFQSVDWGTDQNDYWFVDSGGTDGNSLAWLEGEEVTVLADAKPIGTYTVTSGAISASGYTNYTIGLPYTSIYESMPVIGRTQELDSALRKASVIGINLDFQDTLTCNLGTDSDNKTAIEFSEDSFATTIDDFTGIKTATFPRGVTRDLTIYIDANEPLPLNVRSINPQLQVMVD